LPIDKLDLSDGLVRTRKFFDLKYNNMVKVSGFLSFANLIHFVAVHRHLVQETK